MNVYLLLDGQHSTSQRHHNIRRYGPIAKQVSLDPHIIEGAKRLVGLVPLQLQVNQQIADVRREVRVLAEESRNDVRGQLDAANVLTRKEHKGIRDEHSAGQKKVAQNETSADMRHWDHVGRIRREKLVCAIFWKCIFIHSVMRTRQNITSGMFFFSQILTFSTPPRSQKVFLLRST